MGYLTALLLALPPAAGAELDRKLTDMRDRAAAARAVRDLALIDCPHPRGNAAWHDR